MVGHYANDCPKVVESISPVHSKPVDTLAGKRQTTDDDTSMLNPLDLSNNTGDSDSKSKKLKKSASTESLTPTTELLLPAKDLITNTNEYPLDYDQTIEFMTKVNEVSDILVLVATYTNDIQGVLN